ncbi:putative peptidyl-prolyl cis-trans isomerase Cyp6p [[Candida] railenensis]|uniref:Peptidyl-prolyl cis-trans isomerase n=1 Tax=[Candida] railenensis TaxID=45579 RepID=A0A9P0QM08_9ASCO|nr:putative peptidyl-prolyl cis-trans isomerase Cyp6p [[Candida] railenensis]
MSVLIETTEGNLTVDLHYEASPMASYNFIKLCKIGYYFFSPFHSLEKDFIVSGGDPEYPRETGTSITNFTEHADSRFEHEGSFLKVGAAGAVASPTSIGTLSFISSPNNLIGSSFTITLTSNREQLSTIKNQVTFGHVVEGFQTLDRINQIPVEGITSKRLLKDVRITYIHILHDPFEDPADLKIVPSSSLVPSDYQLATMRLPQLKLEAESSTETESQFNSIALELVGDLPHYQIKPSPRTLFVARLNPITNSESLTIIFSRFGKVENCNVILDPKQNNKSLCYGFIEFESQHQAESAYEKLSRGCVIDGREVYIDFSQSVKTKTA